MIVLILIIAIIISIPFVVDFIRKKDFSDQITGRKAENKCPEKLRGYRATKHDGNVDLILNEGLTDLKRQNKSFHL